MKNRPSAEFQVQFLQNLQRLLSEGQFTATYKFALLQSIADICVEKGKDDASKLEISVADLAEKFANYYWKQSAYYHSNSLLHQNTGQQAAIVTNLQNARNNYGSFGSLRNNQLAWKRVLTRVSSVIKNQPLWKLQTIGTEQFDFLYPVEGTGDTIELRVGVAYCFRLFYQLISDLIQVKWISFVRGLPDNRPLLGRKGDLSRFMFGSDRNSLTQYKKVLTEIQQRTCFYWI